MSKPRLKIVAVIDSNIHADTILADIRTRLVGKDIFDEHAVSKELDEDGNVALNCQWRFNKRFDRDDVENWIKDQIETNHLLKNWFLSARVSSHLCTHDDDEVLDCRISEYKEFVK